MVLVLLRVYIESDSFVTDVRESAGPALKIEGHDGSTAQACGGLGDLRERNPSV